MDKEDIKTKKIGNVKVIDFESMSDEEIKEYLEEWEEHCEKIDEITKELKRIDEETLRTIIY